MKAGNWTRVLLITFLIASFFAFSALATEGENKRGLVTENGITRIYTETGELVKDCPVYRISAEDGFAYYSVGSDGAATKLTGLEEMAAERLVKLNAGSKKSMNNLKKAFLWCTKMVYRNNTNGSKGTKAAVYYGEYGFRTGNGDCNTVAYCFYWMGKVLGYDGLKVVQGHVPDGSMSNLQRHTWCTMKIRKKTYYFDPDFNRAYAGKTVKTRKGMKKLGKYCGFRFTYGTPGTYVYKK